MPKQDESTSVVRLKPPKELQINNKKDMPQTWTTWIQQYHWYEAATNLKKKYATIHVATFMSIIGSDAFTVHLPNF